MSSYPSGPSDPTGGMPPYGGAGYGGAGYGGAGYGGAGYGGAGYGGVPSQPPPPPNHLVPAIVTTILCCLPLGVVSLVYSNQVNNKYQSGDYAGAVTASGKAKNWWIASIVTTAVVAVLWIVAIGAGIGLMSES